LAAGLVVFVSMLAAAVFVWDHELTDWYYNEFIFIKPEQATMPLATLFEQAQTASRHRVVDVDIAADPRRAWVFSTYRYNDHHNGWTHWDDYHHWERIYVNPYTGTVTGKVDMLRNWIDLPRRLHQNLLLTYNIGHYIVGVATIMVLILVATGVILWIPKNRSALKQRLKIKWNARWRRVNYDSHMVPGIYLHLVILLLGTTGLVWTFDWWTNGIYRLLGDDPAIVFKRAVVRQPAGSEKTSPSAWDRAIAHAVAQRPTWTSAFLSLPGAYSEEEQEIAVYVSFNNGSGWDESDSYYYHPVTGLLMEAQRHEEKSTGEKWRNSNYAIHVGSIYGWPTKVLATLAALALASLPVTGFFIWYGRHNKKDRRHRIHETSQLI
jgi:uncharacterized iron-regulated membrane protein